MSIASTLVALTLAAAPAKAEAARPKAPDAADRARYRQAVATLEKQRLQLANEYRRARTRRQRDAILDRSASTVLAAIRDRLLPAWQGTPWAFSGLARRSVRLCPAGNRSSGTGGPR